MIAPSGFLAALECMKFVFGRGSAPDPAGGAYSRPPSWFKGNLLLPGRGGEEKEGREGMEGTRGKGERNGE